MSSAVAAEPTPLEVFEKFIRDRDPANRRRAVGQLAGLRGPKVVDALAVALRDEDAQVRDRAESLLGEPRTSPEEVTALVRALAGKSPPDARIVLARALVLAGPAAAPHLRALLADRDGLVAAVAARGLAALRDRDASPALHALLTSRDALARAAATDAIGEILGAEGAGTASAVALGDHAAEPRVAALRVLGRFPSADSVDHVARCLVNESWSVRVAAAEALSQYAVGTGPARIAARELVRALAREDRRRVRRALADALWGLTGIDFGPDEKRWDTWWREAGERFEPPPRRPQRAVHAANGTHGGLLDLPLESEHVAFVLDMSSSMNEPVRFGVETTKREDLLAAFDGVLDRLPKPSWINVVPFSTEPHPMKPRLFEATPAGRQAALRYLQKTASDGRTNIHDSVEIALDDPETDTIVLLTDGAPSAGRRTSRTGIIEAITERNRYRLARIHTVEVGAANTGARWKGFLADIAAATGGVHLSR